MITAWININFSAAFCMPDPRATTDHESLCRKVPTLSHVLRPTSQSRVCGRSLRVTEDSYWDTICYDIELEPTPFDSWELWLLFPTESLKIGPKVNQQTGKSSQGVSSAQHTETLARPSCRWCVFPQWPELECCFVSDCSTHSTACAGLSSWQNHIPVWAQWLREAN